MNLSDGQRRLVFAGMVVVLAAIGVYLTLATPETSTDQTEPRGNVATAPPPTSAPAAPAATPSGIESTITPENFDIYRLLPFPRREFAGAAALAQQFTAAYGTYRYDEDPQAYIARLEPLATEPLTTELARSVSAPGLLEQRREERVVAQGSATLDRVRDIEANSIIFLVTGHQEVTRSGKTVQEDKQFSVTVSRDGGSFQVYAIELAEVGQAGDTG